LSLSKLLEGEVKNITLSYWAYSGNHPEGRDCPRNNRWGIPMAVVKMGASHPSAQIRLRDKNSFGATVYVTLPGETWQTIIDEYNSWALKTRQELVESGFSEDEGPQLSPDLLPKNPTAA
jgi:hypothetical protein